MQRRFNHEQHIRNVAPQDAVDMFDDLGRIVAGVVGAGGATGVTSEGVPLGVDQIIMSAGSAFPLHVHDGDHLLYVLQGHGGLHVDGVDYTLREGDSIYVPADYPHAVRGPGSGPAMRLLAFGVPHHPVESTRRMRLVTGDDSDRAARVQR